MLTDKADERINTFYLHSSRKIAAITFIPASTIGNKLLTEPTHTVPVQQTQMNLPLTELQPIYTQLISNQPMVSPIIYDSQNPLSHIAVSSSNFSNLNPIYAYPADDLSPLLSNTTENLVSVYPATVNRH